MQTSVEKTMTCAAFARKHGVARTTVQRWRQGGYVVPVQGLVDVARSEALLRDRPAVYKGGVAKGPVADDGEDMGLAYWIDLYGEDLPEGAPGVDVYRAVIADLRQLPAGASDRDVMRVLDRHKDRLRAIR